jgi:mannose-6-phosphate isomerase-like protein (cupin superfamily)
LHYGNREIKIAEGDSVTFNASSPHFIENVCDTEFDAIWMVTPAQKFNT